MAEAVVTCLKLSKPQHVLLSNYFLQPSVELRALAAKRSKLQISLRDIEITGDCDEVLKQACDYAHSWKAYWSQPHSRTLTTLSPLAFFWGALFQEQPAQQHLAPLLPHFSSSSSSSSTTKAGEPVLEGSSCIWFELAMTWVVCGQLLYSLGVEYLEEYKQSAQFQDIKQAGLYFQNAAHMFLQAEHVAQELWTTNRLDFEPAIRDRSTTRLWMNLCLAAAQHCCCVGLQAKPNYGLESLSRLLMAEAHQYSEVLQHMHNLDMVQVMRTLYQQVGSLYIETLSTAYMNCLNAQETDDESVCKKEKALVQVHDVLAKQLPGFSLELLSKEIQTIQRLRTKVHCRQLKESETVPRSMLPVPHLAVKPLPLA